MGALLPERLPCLETALQGVAFWIGHRQSLFRGYPLSEGALVAEACNLIQANLRHGLVLLPERMYRRLVPVRTRLNTVGPLARADLVICGRGTHDADRDADLSSRVRFVIEVKRSAAPKALIDDDLKRLHELRKRAPGVRCFEIVVSEGAAPTRFVHDGKSKLINQKIPGCDGYFRVRRTVKAAASFSKKSAAHYVCLVEVFTKGEKPAAI